MTSNQETIHDLLGRGVIEVIHEQHLATRLRCGKPLRVKLGIDPTSHYLHLGHAVALRKLRAFQRAGHQAILVIGDFTARLGDPSGRDTARPPLSKKQTDSFAETYVQQAGKILDLKKTEIRRNSEWLEALTADEILKLLATTTIQQLLAHETFANRIENGLPLGAHEILYPLLQGYDSVAIRADVELGASEQKFNVLAGRDVQRAYNQDQQDVVLIDYLVGVDGRQKMSKSLGNTINLSDSAEDMFGKIMSIPDKLILPYFTLATDVDEPKLAEVRSQLRKKTVNPRDLKAMLASEIVGLYFTSAEAQAASERFVRVHRKHEIPGNMPELLLRPGGHNLLEVLVSHKLAASRSEARRLIEQGGIRLDRQPIKSWESPIEFENNAVLEVGKRRFYRIRITS